MKSNKNSNLAVFGLAVMVSLSLSAHANPYVYFIREFPVQERNCHEDAEKLAQKFTALTGLPAGGRCEALTKKGADVSIRYEASEPLTQLNNVAEIGFEGRGYEFTTRKKCESELPREMEFFKEMTGREPLVGFCRYDETYYGLQKWALVIEGFAASNALVPAWASSRFPGQPTSEQVQQVIQAVKTSLSNDQVKVRFVFLQPSEHGHLRLTVHYWAKYSEQLVGFSLAEMDSVADCSVALKDLEKVQLLKPQIKSVGLCVNNPYTRGADLVAIIDVTRWHSRKQAVETFANFADCASQKETLISFYKNKFGDKILAGFCTRWGSDWKLNLLEEKL